MVSTVNQRLRLLLFFAGVADDIKLVLDSSLFPEIFSYPKLWPQAPVKFCRQRFVAHPFGWDILEDIPNIQTKAPKQFL
jgi:hypothetical protein